MANDIRVPTAKPTLQVGCVLSFLVFCSEFLHHIHEWDVPVTFPSIDLFFSFVSRQTGLTEWSGRSFFFLCRCWCEGSILVPYMQGRINSLWKPSGPGVFLVGRFLVTDSMVVRLLWFSLFLCVCVPILEHCIFLEVYSFRVKLHNFFPQLPLFGFLQLAVTSHDKTGGLTQTQIYSLIARKPEDQNGSQWAINDVSAGSRSL